MRHMVFATALVTTGLLVGLGASNMLEPASGPSRSYSNGYAYGASLVRIGNPEGEANCGLYRGKFVIGSPPRIPGENSSQYSKGCFAGWNHAAFSRSPLSL
jgi:hypothetical protein